MKYELIQSNEQTQNLTAIEKVLTNRGIKLEDIEHYLHTSEEDILASIKINNIPEGVEMLIKHISQGNKIFIQVDQLV